MGELEPQGQSDIALDAKYIIDRQNGNLKQSSFNTAVNALTNGGNFRTILATDADTNISAVFTRLSITPATDTLYRVGNWKYDATPQYNINYYSIYGTTDGTVSGLVPISLENKGIDDEPVPNSDNPVKSKGIANKITKSTGVAFLRNGSSGNDNNPNVVTTLFVPTYGKRRFKVEITRPNAEGFKYRIGWCITSSLEDLYKSPVISNMAGYVNHRDTFAYEGEGKDLIITVSSDNVGIGIQIDEVKENDSTIVNPLRIHNFEDYQVRIIPYNEDKLFVYTPTDAPKIEIEEGYYINPGVDNKIYIHNAKIVARSRNSSFSFTFNNNEQFAAELGVSLVTSPSGASKCIELSDCECLVFDRNRGHFFVKERYSVDDSDDVLIQCIGGRVISLCDELVNCIIFKNIHDVNEKIKTIDKNITSLISINKITSNVRNGSSGNPANPNIITTEFIPCGKGSYEI